MHQQFKSRNRSEYDNRGSLPDGVCPSCGYAQATAEMVNAGPFSYDPQEGFKIKGRRLAVPPSVHDMLGVLMKGQGKIVSREMLLKGIGSGTEKIGMISVLMHRARRAFASLELEAPIESVHGLGLRWIGPGVAPKSDPFGNEAAG